MGLIRGEHVDAAVRTLFVVEPHRLAHGVSDLPYACKGLSMQQLVLDGAVDALGHGVVLRIAILGHTWDDMVGVELFDISCTGVLSAAVGVVYEGVGESFGQRPDGHYQSFDAVCSLQRRSNVPAQDALAVGVHNDGQEHEAVARRRVGILYLDVGDVADPYIVIC